MLLRGSYEGTGPYEGAGGLVRKGRRRHLLASTDLPQCYFCLELVLLVTSIASTFDLIYARPKSAFPQAQIAFFRSKNAFPLSKMQSLPILGKVNASY